jgi:hypothetical protein
LNLLFAGWAAQQAGGVPAGARSRTYAHWALGSLNTPWRAWAWALSGSGDPQAIAFGDWPELPLSGYRAPQAVADLLAERRRQGSYEVRERRHFDLARRQSVDAALYTWATPDYLLSASQAVDGLALAVSGGQEISAWLLAEGDDYAPLILWSRQDTSRAERWRGRTAQEQAVAHENVLLARMGTAGEPGYAYFAAAWGRPEAVGDAAVVGRYGGTVVALVSDGGWDLAPAGERFPAHFGADRAYRGAWVAVPRRQPAALALVAGRAAEVAGWAAWKQRAAALSLAVERGDDGAPVRLALSADEAAPPLPRFVFEPGRRATVDGIALDPRSYPLHASPFLVHETAGDGRAATGRWRFRFGEVDYRFAPLP